MTSLTAPGLLLRLGAIDPPGRQEAHDAAVRELARAQYAAARPPLLTRLLGRLIRELGNLLDRASGRLPGGRVGLLVLLAVVTALVVLVLVRLRPSVARRRRGQALFDDGQVLTAAQHRELAETAATQGRFADAVRERLRAVVRELEARGVLDPRPGRTAGEVARDGGAAVPAISADLRRGATTFDEVWYGGRAADAASYAVLVEVDAGVTGARLAVA